jgi:small-conductance mechanosensitive channel
MNSMSSSTLWPLAWADLQHLDVIWQIGALALCLALAWVSSRAILVRLEAQEAAKPKLQFGVEGFSRVVYPLIAVLLITVVRPLLAIWQPVNLLNIALPLAASWATIRLVFYFLRRAFSKAGRVGAFLTLFEKVIATLVWACVAIYITGLAPQLIGYLDSTYLPLGKFRTSLLTILQALVSVAVTLIVAMWVGTLMEERVMHLESLHSSLRVVLSRLLRVTLIVGAVLISLSLVGMDLTVLSVFGGALGVGIGLGLQKLVGSYVSGFVILLERSLSIGDRVTVDKFSGKVTQINTRYTIVRGFDGVESVIPNEMLVSGVVQNSSLSDRNQQLKTTVGVDYGCDVEFVMETLREAISAHERIIAEPGPSVALVRFGADALDLECVFWLADPDKGKGNVVSDVNLIIWKKLKEIGVGIPYPTRTLHIENFPAPANAPADSERMTTKLSEDSSPGATLA